MTIDKEKFLNEVKRSLSQGFDKSIEDASSHQLYFAISKAVLGSIWHNWAKTREAYKSKDIKEAYYLSAEFLMGRAMSNNLVNLGVEKDIKEVLESIGLDYNLIEDTERRGFIDLADEIIQCNAADAGHTQTRDVPDDVSGKLTFG